MARWKGTAEHSALAMAAGWRNAVELARRLGAGETPAAIHLWGLPLDIGEHARFDTHLDYARYYGQPDADPLPAPGRSHRDTKADGWRDHHYVRVIATDLRLLCGIGKRWHAFPFAATTGVYPDLSRHTVIVDCEGQAPLALTGPSAPLMTVWIAHKTVGIATVIDLDGPPRPKVATPPPE